jgi:membrane protein CcdC involved in cytochrome C biogenesis
MDFLHSSYVPVIVTVGALVMAVATLFIRLKASRRPVTIKGIIIPPLGMSTGFLMFVVPDMHISYLWALTAFVVGALLFSYPLIRSTHFETIDGQVYAKRSRGFAYILIGLLVVRLVLHGVVEQYITVLQTGSVFFLLAFGMILRWRLYMLKAYHKILDTAHTN